MKQPRYFPRHAVRVLAVSLAIVALAPGQQTGPKPAPGSVESLLAQMQELRLSLDELRDQLAGSRRESQELRNELEAVRKEIGLLRGGPRLPGGGLAAAASQQTAPANQVEALAENQQLLGAKVDDQYQTKVESGSRYRLRLSGLALLNVFSTNGAVDSLDVPRIARAKTPQDSNGSFGATARQSQISLAVSGPAWGSARTSGDVTLDFFGGFPLSREGATSGLVRLRTATLRFDWKNTSVVAGQDALFFSPLSPSSLASTAYPALSSSGNLWTWTPQIHVEHRKAFSDQSKMVFQWGILAPLTGELPTAEYNMEPSAGERSRAPAYAARLAWQHSFGDRAVGFGGGVYYSRQNWGFNRTVDAWAAMADWDVPLGRWLSLSGEAYRGRSIGGLGGGAAGSVLFLGPSSLAASSVLPLSSAGGWSQLKFKPLSRLEFNAAFGEDYPFRSGLSRVLRTGGIEGSQVSRNASWFLNTIYQARSNLLFSVEYRRLWTSSFSNPQRIADHVSLSSGIVF